MKRIAFLVLFSAFLFSCDKDESPNPEIPNWIKPRIEELENSGQCFGCNVTRYTYKNEYYYSVYCGYWSCMFCEVYNSTGQNLQELDNFAFEDFISNRNNEIILWSCPTSKKK